MATQQLLDLILTASASEANTDTPDVNYTNRKVEVADVFKVTVRAVQTWVNTQGKAYIIFNTTVEEGKATGTEWKNADLPLWTQMNCTDGNDKDITVPWSEECINTNKSIRAQVRQACLGKDGTVSPDWNEVIGKSLVFTTDETGQVTRTRAVTKATTAPDAPIAPVMTSGVGR